MPLLKFETKVIDGKPTISFGSEQQKVPLKKSDNKIKNQKYPLRNNVTNQIPKKNSYENELFNRKKPNETKKNSQLVDRNSANSTPEVFINNKINNVNNYRQTGYSKQPIVKETLFNFLKNDKDVDKIQPKSFDKNIKESKQSKRVSLTEEDIDEIMKQVVFENKNLLSEEQLVDILAKLYLDAKISKLEKTESRETSKKEDNQPRKSEERKIIRPKPEEIYESDFKHQINEEKIQKPIQSTELTALQKKQIQWDKERKEMAEIVAYNPWGKPGCGAPTKNSIELPKSEYNYQQKPMKPIENTINKPIENQGNYFQTQENVISQAELKRQQWLTELNEQVAEKERRKFSERDTGNRLGNYQIKSPATEEINLTHGRGKGLADLSQMSVEEMIQKRNKQLEQQEAIRRQIEEKDLQKKLERERKARLDQEEEARVMIEKQKLDTQYMSETARVKQKDDESGKRFTQQRLQLEAAERAALMDKKLKRLQRLELAGHDTRQLRAGFIAEQMSGRLGDSFELRSDDNSLKQLNIDKGFDQFQTDRSPRSYVRLPITEDQSVQTEDLIYKGHRIRENDNYEPNQDHFSHRNRLIETPKHVKYNNSATDTRNRKPLKINNEKRSSSAASNKNQTTKKIKKPEPVEKRKPWGVKKISKKYIPQSKRDPFYSTYQESRETHKQERVNKILALVKANMDRIPDNELNDHRLSHRHKKIENHEISDHDKENYEVNHDTYELKNNAYVNNHDDDRAHGQVVYKDTYRQSNKTNQSHRQVPLPQDTRKSPEIPNDWWHDPNHEIVRTTDVLNPAIADQILPITRENTCRERARQGYYKNLHPAQYGEPLKSQQEAHHSHHTEPNRRDPFYQTPTHPTQRQNTILKQLSDIREGLLLRQKEIETSMSINVDM